MGRAVRLQVALNGPWPRKRQPGVPVRVAGIVEARAVRAALRG